MGSAIRSWNMALRPRQIPNLTILLEDDGQIVLSYSLFGASSRADCSGSVNFIRIIWNEAGDLDGIY